MEAGNTKELLQEVPIENETVPQEMILGQADPLELELDIDDLELSKIIDRKVEDARKFFTDKYDLYERRRKNEIYLFGRQVAEAEKKNEYKVYESRYLDNVLYEIESSIKPLAMNRLPDMSVIPGSDRPESKTVAEDLTKVVDNDLRKREARTALAIGFKHLPVYFTGILKARWDYERDDYVFEVVHPDNVDVDQFSISNCADDMGWISHLISLTVQQAVMRFPDKKEKLFEELRKDGINVGVEGQEPTTKDLATEIKIREIWFDWYKRGEEKDWQKVSGVMWKYKTLILKKIRNPNFDYEGEEKWFRYEESGNKSTRKEIETEELRAMALWGLSPTGATKERTYHNYFDCPRKPFFFFGYDQWRKIAYDETSRLEQNIRNQENMDRRGKQITDALLTRVKHILSKDSGMKAEDLEGMDLDDPRQHLLVEGNVNNVHTEIRPERPDAATFKDLNDTRARMYAVAGATAVRGEVQSEVATNNQIAREADYTRADDLVEETINAACEWMAQWSMQFIKLRYTENHLRKLLGEKSQPVFLALNRDMVEDGMEVTIKSSSTDKLKAQRNAMDMAKLQLIDPLSFYEDMGVDDPKGRAAKLMDFTGNPATYILKYLSDKSITSSLVNQLGAIPVGGVQPPAVPSSPSVNPTVTDTTQVPTEPLTPSAVGPGIL